MNISRLITLTRRSIATAALIFLVLAPAASPAAQVTLAWDPNAESNLAGYAIYWGTASRSYEHKATIGKETSFSIEGLQEGQIYYFAVTASDTDSNESDYSTELVYAVPVPDSDGDGISDDNEVNLYGTDPQNPDTDQDQMDDGWEINHGTDPLVDDSGGDLDGDGISNIDEYNGITPPGNDSPVPPILSYPLDGENDVSLTPVLVTGAFNTANVGAAHARTQWQISNSKDFSTLIFSLDSAFYLDRLNIPDLILQRARTYWWRARFFNSRGKVSEWSQPFQFKTVTSVGEDLNADGVPDRQAVDLTVDLDQNGVPDQTQDDIKCVRSVMDGSLIGIKGITSRTDVLALKSVHPNTVSESQGRPEALPAGLISFRLAVENAGDRVDVNIHFDTAIPAEATWFKFTPARGWQDYSTRVFFSPDRKLITFSIQDGGFGDADGTANGIIVDPAGFGLSGSDRRASGTGGGCFIDTVSTRWSWPPRSDPQ